MTRNIRKAIIPILLSTAMLCSSCGGGAAVSPGASQASGTQAGPSAAPSESAAATASGGGAAAHNDTIRIPVTTSFSTTDPQYVAQNADFMLAEILYDSFYYVDEKGQMYPRLAEGYDVSDDGLTYTYHLRSNVKWQTGGDFSAPDVLYSLTRAKDSPYMMQYMADVADFTAPDPMTVVITLSEMSPTFYMDINRVPFLSETAAKDVATGFSDELPGGTGPYTITSWQPDKEVIVTRNDDYYGDPAPTKTIDFTVFGDTNGAVRAFEAGELDYVPVLSSDWERIKSSGKYNAYTEDSISVIFFSMNNEKAPFDDARVRQAFNYAANKQDMLTASVDGNGRIVGTLGNPELVFGVPEPDQIFQYTYDPNKAKSLLAEAGYPDGLTLDDPILTMAGDEYTVPAQILQSNLADIGVTAQIQTVEQSAYVNDMINGNYSIGIMALSLGVDASMYAMAYTTDGINALNLARYSNPDVDGLFDKASKTLDQDQRAEYFKEAYDTASKDAAYLPLYSIMATNASDPDLYSTTYQSFYYWKWN